MEVSTAAPGNSLAKQIRASSASPRKSATSQKPSSVVTPRHGHVDILQRIACRGGTRVAAIFHALSMVSRRREREPPRGDSLIASGLPNQTCIRVCA
jgi:hypothetical protein